MRLDKLLSFPPVAGAREFYLVNSAECHGVILRTATQLRPAEAWAVSRWVSRFGPDDLLAAEAASNTTTPGNYLVTVKVRRPYERQARTLVVDALRLPGARRWVVA